MKLRPRRGGLALLALLMLPMTACGGHDSYGAYCDEVKAQQTAITEALGQPSSTALLSALPFFEKLRDKAPADISDDWATVVRRIMLLKQALDDAGVDPSTYSSEHPPSGLSKDQLAGLAAAASGLAAPDTSAALDAVQQEARDVCQTPLSL